LDNITDFFAALQRRYPLFCSELAFTSRSQKQAEDLVLDAFPPENQNKALDSAVVVVSGDLLDDYPASDPRWAESVPHGEASMAR